MQYLRACDTLAHLGVNRQQLYYFVKSGKLTRYKVGKNNAYDEAEVIKLKEEMDKKNKIYKTIDNTTYSNCLNDAFNALQMAQRKLVNKLDLTEDDFDKIRILSQIKELINKIK